MPALWFTSPNILITQVDSPVKTRLYIRILIEGQAQQRCVCVAAVRISIRWCMLKKREYWMQYDWILWWRMGTKYSLENILVICAIVGLCLLIIAIVTLISIFTSRWRYTMSREHDLEDSRYDNTIISSYEGDSSMWTTEGTFRTLEELWDLKDNCHRCFCFKFYDDNLSM